MPTLSELSREGTKGAKQVIRFSVEVEGQTVFSESYDLDALEKSMASDEQNMQADWARRLKCALCCRTRMGFVACFARCLFDGQCCDGGVSNCRPV